MNLSMIDLNLLRVFHFIYRERSVSRAAVRLGLTQSATSNALSRLRETFADELFLRTPRGVEPTARASQIAEPIQETLAQVEALLSLNRSFDPATASTRFVLGMSDYAEFVLAPALLRDLRRLAPGVDLTIRHADRTNAFTLLEEESVMLAIGVLPEPPAPFLRTFLLRERFVALCDPAHPIAGQTEPDLDTYLSYPHLLVSNTGGPRGAVDWALDAIGRSRRLLAIASHFAVIGPMLRGSDLICTLSERAALPLAAAFGLASFSPPIAIEHTRLSSIFHRRNQQRPADQWLRQQIAIIARNLTSESR
jgi:DNA-binding transcriptional LysR family regulator